MNRYGNMGAAYLLAFALAVCAALACPDAAPAWEVSKSSNGVVITRSVDDTASVDVSVFSDYEGGETWTDQEPIRYVSSWLSETELATIEWYATGSAEVVIESVEIPLDPDGGRCQAVRLYWTVDGVGYYRWFAVLNEPLDVRGSVETSATAVAPVRLAGTDATLSVSADTTLPVAVSSVGAFDGGELAVFLSAVVAACGVAVGMGLRYV